jgi:hypothetical protein
VDMISGNDRPHMPPLSVSLGGRATREADEDVDLCRPPKVRMCAPL